jgi:formate dehydrogenase iron-sulfur subunit
MSIKIFVSKDSTALSLGADQVAEAILKEAQARKLDIQIVRHSSRGVFWLETLVEVETVQGRIGFGPINPNDAKSLFDADFINGGKHVEGLPEITTDLSLGVILGTITIATVTSLIATRKK